MITITKRNRYPAALPWVLYISSIQYFVIQLIAAIPFTPRFSIADNTISDLGNTVCGPYGNRLVCSPLHILMNVSLVVVGLTIIFGSIFAYKSLPRSRATLVGFALFASGGLGTILVGLFPENTVAALHVLGAALPFAVGNAGLVMLGLCLPLSKTVRLYTLLSGLIALIATLLLITGNYAGLGLGGMERIAAYPQTIWMILLGFYCLNRSVKRKTK